MRRLFVGLVALGTVVATPAFAGTSAYNSYKTTNEVGHRQTTIDVHQENHSVSNIDSKSIKMEAFKQ